MHRRRLTTEEFIEKALKVHGDRFDYSKINYVNTKTKVTIICPEHGEFEQRPDNHLQGKGCSKCYGHIKLSTEEFIERAIKVHGNRFDYSKVNYVNTNTKVIIICPIHGEFEQRPDNHLGGIGCFTCSRDLLKELYTYTMDQFIEKALKVHGNKFDYSKVNYINSKTKVTIICPEHGEFEQAPCNHLFGRACSKCYGLFEKPYAKNNIPLYETYVARLEEIGVDCRRNKDDENILETKCFYCNKWYIPKLIAVYGKLNASKNISKGEGNLYCSNKCKMACPTFGQKKYPRDFKIATSREVQSSLRKLVLERDNWTCQRCKSKENGLHCHHYEGIQYNPIESADMDMCTTLCKKCHKLAHKEDGCRYVDLQCNDK